MFADLDTALKAQNVKLVISGLTSVCKAAGKFSRFIKGCPCHRKELEGTKTESQRRKALLAAGVPDGKCIWMGRVANDLVHGGCARLCHLVRHYQSTRLKEVIAESNPRESGVVLQELEEIQADLANEYDMKVLVPWSNLPNRTMGIFGEAFGMEEGVIAIFLQDLCDEYDAIADKEKCHRRIRQCLDPGSKIRKMIDHKIANHIPMCYMLELWMYAGELAFTLLHSSANEGQHRTIKADTRNCGRAPLPGYVGASMRSPDLANVMEDDSLIFSTPTSMAWIRRGIREIAAVLLVGPLEIDELKRMKWREKFATVYQYSMGEQEADSAEIHLDIVQHKLGEKRLWCQYAGLSNSASACVVFVEGALSGDLPLRVADIVVFCCCWRSWRGCKARCRCRCRTVGHCIDRFYFPDAWGDCVARGSCIVHSFEYEPREQGTSFAEPSAWRPIRYTHRNPYCSNVGSGSRCGA